MNAWTWIKQRPLGLTLAAAGLAIPTSVGGASALLGLAFLTGLLTGTYRRQWRALLAHPLAGPALALFAWLLVGCLHGPADWSQALDDVRKYRELLYLLLLLPLFLDARWQRWALYAFLAAMYLTLLLSLAKAWGWAPELGKTAGEFVIFKNRITQNTLMALTAYWTALRLLDGGPRRFWWALPLALMAYDIFFLVGGRTGHLVFLVLLVLLLFQRYRWRGLAAGILAAALLAGSLYLGSGIVRERLQEVEQESSAQGELTSSALRIRYLRNSLDLVLERPLLGFGTGAFSSAYQDWVAPRGAADPPTSNPHNEFLRLGVTGGLTGMGLFIWLLLAQWRCADRLAPQQRALAQALVATMAVGCLFNSFLYDHTEGHLWAFLSAVLYAPLLQPEPPAP